MRRPAKVCCFCETWESGGIESFLHNILLRMDFRQIEVDIVAARLGESVFTNPLQQHGVRFIELSGNPGRVAANHQAFRRLLRERSYDVVHLNVFQGLSLYYAVLARQAGIPVRIAHSHNTALRRSLTRPVKLAVHAWAKGRFTRYATDLWACSRGSAEFLFSKEQLTRNGFQFIPNGIEVERFRFDESVREAVREELGLRDQFVIGNVGRLCGQKNQEFLLDLLQEVCRLRPKSVLLLVGEGEDKPRLMERAKMLGLKDNVIFYGATGQVERLYWAMDVFAFPSLFEGLGIAGVEAQAAGLPVLCSEHVPGEALITGQVTRLPLSAGPAAWAEAVLKAEVTAERVCSADQVAAMGFDVERVAERIKESFQKGH